MAEIVMCADKNLISTIWNKMNIVKIRYFLKLSNKNIDFKAYLRVLNY